MPIDREYQESVANANDRARFFDCDKHFDI